jgi:hypothetical protein
VDWDTLEATIPYVLSSEPARETETALLAHLTAAPEERARSIGQLHRSHPAIVVEVLIDLEANDAARLTVIEQLRDLTRTS